MADDGKSDDVSKGSSEKGGAMTPESKFTDYTTTPEVDDCECSENYAVRRRFTLPQIKIVRRPGGENIRRPASKSSTSTSSSSAYDHKRASTTSNGQREFERKNFWECCCSEHIDKRMVTFLVQVFISVMTLMFCMMRIVNHGEDSEDPTIWVSLMSGIVGNYLPSIQLK